MVLKSIYEDQLEVARNKYRDNSTTISMMLHPSTAEDVSSQYVRLQLEMTVCNNNENMPVEVKVKTSRGLSDDQLQGILSLLNDHAHNNIGDSVLFDLIELTKDTLTSNNIPSCPCPICLAQFQEFDDFLKTECYHYLHSFCLYEYVIHWKEEKKQEVVPRHCQPFAHSKDSEKFIPCPVCREPVFYDIDTLSKSMKPIETPLKNFNLDSIKQEVKKMEAIFNAQKEKGGIINLEAEKNKYLLSSIEEAYRATTSHMATNTAQEESISTSFPQSNVSQTCGENENSAMKEDDVIAGSGEKSLSFKQDISSSTNGRQNSKTKNNYSRTSSFPSKRNPLNTRESDKKKDHVTTKSGEKSYFLKNMDKYRHYQPRGSKLVQSSNRLINESRSRSLSTETSAETNRASNKDPRPYRRIKGNTSGSGTGHQKETCAKVSEPRPAYAKYTNLNARDKSKRTVSNSAKESPEC